MTQEIYEVHFGKSKLSLQSFSNRNSMHYFLSFTSSQIDHILVQNLAIHKLIPKENLRKIYRINPNILIPKLKGKTLILVVDPKRNYLSKT